MPLRKGSKRKHNEKKENHSHSELIKPKGLKFMRNDLDKMEQKEYQRKKELGRKSKLPKGIFENVGGKDNKSKSKSKKN